MLSGQRLGSRRTIVLAMGSPEWAQGTHNALMAWAREARLTHRRGRREELDAVSVEAAAGAVVVFGGAGVGMAGQDLRVTKRHAGVEGRW